MSLVGCMLEERTFGIFMLYDVVDENAEASFTNSKVVYCVSQQSY